MASTKRIKIFLASPSDVPQERKLVRKVLDELNEVVGREKDVFFDLYSSEHAYPGFGTDGQAIINDQIGDLRKYDMFLAMMWNRIGTPTPRAESGTVEEFNRAVAARKNRKKPDIWLFFRSTNTISKDKPDSAQQARVTTFKSKIRGKGLFREYTGPQDFETQLRKHLQRWLNARLRQAEEARLLRAQKRQQNAAQPTGQAGKAIDQPLQAKARTPLNPTSRKRKIPTRKASEKRNVNVAKSPGKWILLGDSFYQTQSVDGQADGTVIVRIEPANLEQKTELRALHPTTYHSRKQIKFASELDAGMMYIQSATPGTSGGKTVFTLTLSQIDGTQQNAMLYDANYPGYSTEDIAQLRARLILLGEPLPKEMTSRSLFSFQRSSFGTSGAPGNNTLPQLWKTLKTTASSFLPKAWLFAWYTLKTEGIIETIQELELGPVQKKKMRVKFRGQRRKVYSNHDPATIAFEGDCSLES